MTTHTMTTHTPQPAGPNTQPTQPADSGAPSTNPSTPAIRSRRVLGALGALVFAVGLLAGAALGPPPESSLANSSTIVQRVIALLAARASESSHESALASSTPPTSHSQATRPAGAHDTHRDAAPASAATPASDATPTSDAAPSTSTGPEGSHSDEGASPEPSPSGAGSEGEETAPSKPVKLPPIQHVWLIMLGGSTFAGATATPASYPYLVGQLLERGSLLTSYSALDAYELAGDATLLPGGVGASLSVISEPACGTAPPAQAAAPCPAGDQPSPAEADAFLQQLAGPILASPAYRENGLIVVTFALSSQSAGAPEPTIAPQPTTGALLLSPLLHAGTRSASAFNSLSPRTSLAAIFKR
jgi:hypothetical protein